MKSIAGVISDNPMLQQRFKEHRNRLLNDKDIKIFLDENEGLVDDAMIERSMGKLNEFYVRRNDPHHKPQLIVYNHSIDILYAPRDYALYQRQEQRIAPVMLFDDTTRPLQGLKLADYPVKPSNSKAFNFANDFAGAYKFGGGFNGMWLCGRRGVGKTLLMGSLAGELREKGVGVTFVNSSFLEVIMDTARDFNLAYNKTLDKYRKSEILIVDDIGTEFLNVWTFKKALMPILEHRMANKLPTFFTTNFTIDEYVNHVSSQKGMALDNKNQLKTRLQTLCAEVEMTGADMRPKATGIGGYQQS